MPVQTKIQIRRDTATNWSTTNPTLAAGEIGFDTTSNQMKIGNGSTAWNTLAYASGGASVEIAQTAPASPEVGDVWYNSTEGTSYIYYDSFWVPLSPALTGPAGKFTTSDTAPASPTTGDGWFNSSTAKLFIYYDSFWVEATSNYIGPAGPTGPQGPAVTSMNASAIVTTVSDKAANYTLLAADKNTYIRSTASTGSEIAITVPDVLANGESVNFIQAGTGQITFLGSGITLNSVDSKAKTNKRFSGATVTKLGGAYYLVGDII